MGCLFVLVLAGVSAAMIFFLGYSPLVMVVVGSLWLAAILYSAIYGHWGFGGGGNTDLNIVIAGLFVMAAIFLPKYEAQKPCNQARMALRKLADAENKYFSEHKAFTGELPLLHLTLRPEVDIVITKADEKSFVASASHKLCDRDKDGKVDLYVWDSAKGGFR